MLCIILQSLNEYFSLVIMWSRCFWIIFCKCMKFWTYSAWLPDASVTSNFCVKNVAFKVSLKFKCVLVGKIDSPQNPLARHLSVQTVRERFSVWPVNIQDWVPAFAYESHLITATEYRGTFFSPSKFKVLFYTEHSFFEGERPGNTNWCHSFFTLFGPAFTLCEDCLILDGFWGTDVLFVLQFVWPLFKHLLGAQSPMAPYWQHIENVPPHFTAPQYITL